MCEQVTEYVCKVFYKVVKSTEMVVKKLGFSSLNLSSPFQAFNKKTFSECVDSCMHYMLNIKITKAEEIHHGTPVEIFD